MTNPTVAAAYRHRLYKIINNERVGKQFTFVVPKKWSNHMYDGASDVKILIVQAIKIDMYLLAGVLKSRCINIV